MAVSPDRRLVSPEVEPRRTLNESTTATLTSAAAAAMTEGQQQQQHSESSSSDPATVSVAASEQPDCLYDPERVFSPEQLQVFEALVHPVWIFDVDNRKMAWANSAALVLWNAPSLEELLKRSFDDMSEATLNRLKEYQRNFQQGQRISDQWTLYPKGEAKQLQVHCSGVRLDPLERNPSMMVEGIPLVKDVEDQIMKETIRGVEMLRHLPMHVCQFDLGGKVMFQNPEAAVIEEQETEERGCDGDSSMGDVDGEVSLSSSINPSKRHRSGDFVDRFVDPKVGLTVLERIRSGADTTADLEAQIHTNHGPRWSAIQLRKTVDPVTGDAAFLYSARDISDAIQAKKDREAKERKSEFLAIMAHEIRTPLHQIIGFTDLLDQTTDLDAEQKGYISTLKQCSRGLISVVSDVLDYSKLEAGKMKMEHIAFEPKSVVESTMAAVQNNCEEKGITLALDWNKNLPFKMCGDPNRFRQVLLNLMSNAVKFTDEGSVHISVEIETTGNAASEPLYSKKRKMSGKNGQTPREMMKVIVADTGMGIPEEHQNLIFNKYHQSALSIAREHGGTGLGLTICKLLVATMGGTIGLESAVGSGSSFWFTLPVEIPADVDVVEALDDEIAAPQKGLNILVVEDNKVNQKLLKRMLERLDHTSTVAENGQVAIDLIEQNTYDLVLMDIQMPVMDGLEATKRLRGMGYANLPIFGLTASVSRSDFSDLGFDDWIPKPVTLKDLKTRLLKLQQEIEQKNYDRLETIQDEVFQGGQ